MHESPRDLGHGRVHQIWLYPIKSLTGICVSDVGLLPSAGLDSDRRWALFGAGGRVLTQKRCGRLGRVVAEFRDDPWQARFQWEQSTTPWMELERDSGAIGSWFSRVLDQDVELRERYPAGWPDDTEASGPTVVSCATLETVADWFPEVNPETVSHRFRPNIVVSGVPAFWEDGLLPSGDELALVRVGDGMLRALNACRRCVVPTRDPLTGEATESFIARFTERRRATLPSWVPRERFPDYYRLTINTRVASREAVAIRVGDSVAAI